uniref:Alkyl transferase n=1 Tax=Opuntia streptacantha TaxID=393608 RepID=A0A7C9EQL0_OPUST
MLGLSKSMSLRPRTAVGLFPSTRPSGVIVSPKSLVQTKCSSSSGSKNGRVAITTQGGEGVFGSGGPMKMSPDRNPCSSVGLRRELMPKHVAAILDGNRRWAQLHGKELDYDAFCYGYLDLADLCIKWGIPTLTCFIFSTENWKRTKEANNLLFGQFKQCLENSSVNFTRKGIKVSVLGEKTELPKDLQEAINQVEDETKSNSKLELNFAVNYGGKWDVVEAIRNMSKKAKAKEIKLQDVDEALMDQLLSTSGLRVSDPDLMIRTGGDQREQLLDMANVPH